MPIDGQDQSRAHDEAPTLHISGACAVITLNRPSKRNRLERGDLDVISRHMATIAGNRAMRAAIFTATGPIFSAGFDIGSLGEDIDSGPDPFEAFTDAVEALPFPTIAALNGPIYGGGGDFALACDVRIGAKGMTLLMPAANLGLNYYGRGLRRFVARLGLGASRRIFLEAEKIDCDSLLAMGFLDEVVEAEHVMDRAVARAALFAAKAPLAVEGMKAILNASAYGRFDEEEAIFFHRRAMQSADLREGRAAFSRRQTPSFRGE